MITFGESMEKFVSDKAEFESRQQEYIDFKEHLLDISGDYSGSTLDIYLSESDINDCHEFLNYMEERNFPNAQNISMKYARVGQYAWSKPDRFANALFRKINSHRVWRGVGYYIGNVAVGYRECGILLSPLPQDDSLQIGELRCDRDPHSFSASHGLGFGRLPDMRPDKLPLSLPTLGKLLVGYAKNI